MVGVLPVLVDHLGELPEHVDVVGLPPHEGAHGREAVLGDGAPAEVLAVQDLLRLHQLGVELVEGHAGGQHGVGDVEEAIVARGEPTRLREPDLRAGIGRGHGQVDDFRHRHGPFADDLEATLVPVAVGDDVDGDHQPELPRDLQRLEILPRCHALAVELERFLVEGFEAEKHIEEPELLPVLEQIAVLDQHVAAGLEVVLLLHLPPLQLLPDGEAVLGMDEGHVVHEEDVGLADGGEILGRLHGRRLPVAPAVERPRAAERAVPRAAARQLGGRAGVEHADEVFFSIPREITGGEKGVEVLEKSRGGPAPLEGHHPGECRELGIADRLQHAGGNDFALAADHAVDGPVAVLEQLVGDEGSAVPADHEEAVGEESLRLLGEIDDLRRVGEVVHGEADGLRPEGSQLGAIVGRGEDLKVEEANLVAGRAYRRSHALESDGLETQVELGIHQRAGMDEEHSHVGQYTRA